MKYKVIVFDWDGTLINSLAKIVSCLQLTISDLGFAKKTIKQAESVIGLGLDEAILTLMPEVKQQPELLNDAVTTYRKHFFSNDIPDSPLFAGAKDVLDYLLDKNYILAVATGKSLRGLKSDLASNKVENYFVTLKTADKTKSKPDPLMLNQIIEELGIEKKQVLMIGDTTFDLEMANNAGVDCIGITTGAHDKELLAEYNPQTILSDITQLYQIL